MSSLNAFQVVVLAFLVVLVSATVRSAARGGIRKRIALFWLATWASSGVALVWPEVTKIVARKLGIGRGTDLVLYVSVFAMLAGFFYIYTRFRRLDRTLTLLVRELALERARVGEPARGTDAAIVHGGDGGAKS